MTRVFITEVSPRDGLQAEKVHVPLDQKIRLVDALLAAGLERIELTSFVAPRAVPQMADAGDLVRHFRGRDGATFSALVPNPRGAADAIAAGVDAIVLFASASESHNLKNVNATRAQSFDRLAEVARMAEGTPVRIHGAIATAFGCPFEGDVAVGAVVEQARRYRDFGVERLTLGDTTGMATPANVTAVVTALRRDVPDLPLAMHFHNTRGLGLVCAQTALSLGIRDFEASVGGLGGCPFVPRATGNIATEDFAYLCAEAGLETGTDLGRLIAAAEVAQAIVGRELPGQVMKAGPRLMLSGMETVRTAKG